MLAYSSYLRNPNYHQSTDTLDTLDYARITEVKLGVAFALRYLSGLRSTYRTMEQTASPLNPL